MIKEHSVSLGMYNGAMALFIDGKPQPFTHYKINEKVDLRESQEIVNEEIPGIAERGINLCWVPVFVEWKAPGKYDFTEMDERISNVLDLYDRYTPQGKSKAAIVIRIQAASFFPDWYVNANKIDGQYSNKVRFRNYWGPSEPVEIKYEERFQTKNSRYGEPYAISPGDKFWDTYAIDCLEAIIKHVKKQDYHSRVFGYLPCALSTNEWFLHCDSPNSCCDFSAPMQHRFFEYLQEKGIDCSYSPVPTPRETFESTELFLDPDDFTDKRVEEFSLFINQRVSDIIMNFCRVIKSFYRDKNKLAGCFYGYTMELAPIYNLSQSGHIALHRLLECPDVDFFCGPLQYRYRADLNPFTYCQAMGIYADSAALYNKLAFVEDDHSPSLSNLFSRYDARDDWHDEMFFRRCFASQVTHGQYMWWYSIGNHWFRDIKRQNWIKELNELGKQALEMDRSPVAEVAVVVDERSISAVRPNPSFWENTLLRSYSEIYPAGTPFEIFELNAFLNKADHKRYKVVIFLNLFRYDQKLLRQINHLKRNGRSLVFMGPAGLIFDAQDGKRSKSISNASTLIEMNMKTLDRRMQYSLWLDPDRTDFLKEKTDLRFGSVESYNELPAVDDNSVEAIAYWFDASVGMAIKSFSDWNSIFIGAPRVPAKVWRQIFQNAGVHCYAQCGDVAYANASMVAYSSSSWGMKTLSLPYRECLKDIFSGKILGIDDNNNCQFHMRKNEVRIFFREKYNI